METKEYRTIDKTAWRRGEWDTECDKVQWPDRVTGLPCLAVRNQRMGFLCGYVGVAPGHPLHGKSYDDTKNADGEYINVHGGLTFADRCQPEATEASGICHVPGPGEPHDVWWFGFDCGHANDLADMAYSETRKELYLLSGHGQYRSLDYVREQCALLAQQLNAIK